jgi:2-C-methyl-D-erythritol 2,4-cyclodiphosphate synthase
MAILSTRQNALGACTFAILAQAAATLPDNARLCRRGQHITDDVMSYPILRVGEGWDTHALVTDRPLILGGVDIPHTHGLLGQSDADALLHAITDAVLGAAGLGDIGRHFPDTDPAFKGADSVRLLSEAVRRVREAGWQLANIDSTIVAQAPKMAPHIPAMRERIAQATGLAVDAVNVKAKTAEKMGPVGEGRAIEARAVCLLIKAA